MLPFSKLKTLFRLIASELSFPLFEICVAWKKAVLDGTFSSSSFHESTLE